MAPPSVTHAWIDRTRAIGLIAWTGSLAVLYGIASLFGAVIQAVAEGIGLGGVTAALGDLGVVALVMLWFLGFAILIGATALARRVADEHGMRQANPADAGLSMREIYDREMNRSQNGGRHTG